MNAQFHKVIFSKRLGTLVAVGEHASAQGKSARGEGARGAALAAAVFLAGLSSAYALDPSALPTGHQVAAGQVQVTTSGARMDISQLTDTAVVNWQSFNVGTDARVNVVQNDSQSVLLNRVVGNEMSQIRGQINANGQVILVNPNGIVMGPTGRITASAFTASSFDISDADFQAGQMRFQRSAHSGAVINQGSIESTDAGGYVALIGADVSNQGTITTSQGAVVLAAADAVTLPNVGAINDVSVPLSRNVRLEINPASFGSASVSNSGVIVTDGGQVLLRAAAVVDAVSKIANATVVQSGNIDTSGVQGGGVDILADNGRIRVSGRVKANSTNGTAGGDVYIGRDQETNVLAASGDASGAHIESKDGFVETSGHQLTIENTQVIADTWLLDPDNIHITNTASANSGYSKVSAADISTALNAGANVVIHTTAGVVTSAGSVPYTASNPGEGNILVSSLISKTTSGHASLTLIADNGLTVNAGISASGLGTLDIQLTANGQTNGLVVGSMSASERALSRGLFINGVGLNANGGDITLTGTSYASASNNPNAHPTNAIGAGVQIHNGASLSARDITVTGVASNLSGDSSSGVRIQRYPSVSTFTASGNIHITGTLEGMGNGSAIALRESGWGTQSITMTAGGSINLIGNNRASSSNPSESIYIGAGLQARAVGDIAILAEANNSAVNAISMYSNSNTAGLYGNVSLRSVDANGVATGDLLIQTNQGGISFNNQLPSNLRSTDIVARNISIDNTGGTVDANTGAIAQGAGQATSAFSGINFADTRSFTASGNIHVAGVTGANSQWGVNLNSSMNATSIHVYGQQSQSTAGGGIYINGLLTSTNGNIDLTGDHAGTNGDGLLILKNITAQNGDISLNGATSSTTTATAAIRSSARVTGNNITLLASATATTGSALGYYGVAGVFDASQQLSLTGTSLSTGNGLYTYSGQYISGTGMVLVGSSSAGKGMNFDASLTITNATSGGISITSSTNSSLTTEYALAMRGVTITNGGGDITVASNGGDIVANTGNPAWGQGVLSNRITQNGVGNILLRTAGNSNLTVPIIINNGTGDVIVAAGSNIAAGTGTGGQVLTVSGNTITQNSTGRTLVYTGQASATGQLSHLSASFNQLVYQGSSLPLNTQFNTTYGGSTITGAPAQVLFRDASANAPVFTMGLNNISKTYGDADPAVAARNTALLNAYTGPSTLTTAVSGANSGSNTFAVTAANVINGLTGTSRAAGSNVGTYAYTNVSASAFNTTLNAQPSLVINQRNITLTDVTATTKLYDGNTVATIDGGTFGNIVAGETLAFSGSGYFNSRNVNGVSTVTVNDVAALTKVDGTGLWNNYKLTTTGTLTSNTVANQINAVLLTATVNGSSIFVTQNASTAPDMGVRYSGFVGGDSADRALSGTAVRSYSGLSSYPAAATYAGVFDLGTVPTANHGNYTINVVPGDLQVIPADRLLISIGSQSVDYGSQTQARSGIAAIGSVTAVYCLNASNCNGSNLYSLTTTRLSDAQWRAADNAGGVVLFSSGITGGAYSSGGYLRVGNYQFTQSAITRLSASGDPILNFTNSQATNGFLTVEPLTVNPTLSASDKTFDGTTDVTLSTSISGLSGDTLSFDHVSASFDNASVGNNKTVTLYGVQLQGTDADNYRLASPSLTTLASILALPEPTPGPKPTPPVVKPVIPGPITPTPNGVGQTTLDDGGDSNSNPFALSVETDECRLDNLTACECEPNPLDETMDICYVPNRSGQASIAAPRS